VAIPVVLSGISDAIATFVAAGARDILVPNMPNLGVIPAITPFGQDFIDLATALSAEYNQAFDAMLAQWEGQVNIIPFDTFALITNVVKDPEASGFSNATEACYEGFVAPNPTAQECDDPDSFVFWDVEHPTAAFHAFLADRVMAAIVLDILDDLGQQVSELDVRDQLKNVLNNKLDGASQKLADGNSANDHAAAGKLTAFINIVEANQGKQIPEDDALSMIMRAEKVIALLDVEQ
jgi:phospholipase/lecithinase/hemolysin